MTGHEGEELRDIALHDEIELVGELIVAASTVDGPLSDREIDDALGVCATASARGVPKTSKG
ncbi:hypothetical protein [Lapillicoccus sp.]|uniref:hypothetical protein n=1 Tax=Lapillicoccus sp. TaxID=1909287 RepID=UPI0025E0B78A|nr:hypothetical protein [Lapillicoccus sp.]